MDVAAPFLSFGDPIMSDTEKVQQPIAPPAQPPAVEQQNPAPPAATTAETPKDAPTPPTTSAPPPARGNRPPGKKPGGGYGGGGQGGSPRRRTREPMPSLDEPRFQAGPRLKDLDAEIEGELEAALAGMSASDLLGAETSAKVRQQAGAAPDHGRKKGTVLSVHGQDVFVEVPGGRSQGVLPILQFPEGPPKPGTAVEVSIEGYDRANGLLILTRLGAAVVANWSSIAEGMTVEARVVETNKGGLAVDVNGIRGFMPISQIDLYRVDNVEQFVNQRLLCLVTEVNPEERNLVVSRRALLEKQREELREKTWSELAEGQVRQGIVRSVRDFGAFVDLGGVDGLLHVSEMSWKRVQNPTEVVQPGQTVKVVVLRIDQETRKVGLGLKQLEASPWDNIREKYAMGQTVEGKVSRTMDFGAFVELEPGVEGLVHISELARGKTWRVTDVVKSDQTVVVKVLSVDADQRRISLSLKAALPQEVVKKAEDEEEEEVEEVKSRPRNVPLRGGVGQDSWLPPAAQTGEDD
jgi:small subunit ribosomal protein S1